MVNLDEENDSRIEAVMEDLEQIMRKIHVLFAKCEPYGEEKENKIIVSKKEVFRLLEQLNYAVVELMDRYEGTAESRERGLGDYRRKGDKIIEEAQSGAEDVYAASLIYTDNMIYELEDVLAEARENLKSEYARMEKRLDEQARILTTNQEEIKEQLQAMSQGDKYLNIIYRENLRLHRIEAAKKAADAREPEEEDWEEDFDEGADEPEDMEEENDSEDASDELSGEQQDDASGRNAGPERGNGERKANGQKDAGINNSEGKMTAGQKAGEKKTDSGKLSGKKSGKSAAKRKPQRTIDLEAEWEEEQENRPVRKIGTALYQEVGQSYDPPVKKVSYEVKVNQAYFDQLGEGNIDLDAEYYQWKEEQEGKSADKTSEEAQPETAEAAGHKKAGKDKHRRKFGKRK